MNHAALSYRPYSPLGERIGIRRLDGRCDDLGAIGGKDVIEGAVNLLSQSRIRKRGVAVPSGRSIEISPARWTTQGSFG